MLGGLPAGVSFASGGNPPARRFATAPADSLREARERRLVSQIFTSWNQMAEWLRRVDGVRAAA